MTSALPAFPAPPALDTLLTPDQLEERLRAIGAERYHRNHPLHKAMYAGELTREQLQAWALNRYYYQAQIPVKDATLMARLPTPELRREWRRRIVDHDGTEPADTSATEGGVTRWLHLTRGLGLTDNYVTSLEGLLPGTRYAVDAYVAFVRDRSILAAIASSLTELFSPTIIPERMSGMLRHYPFITEETMAYFKPRLTQAPRDSEFALAWVRAHARTPETQAEVIGALEFKCGLLWTLLDVLDYSYGRGAQGPAQAHIPPGSFVPEGYVSAIGGQPTQHALLSPSA
ncbi:pyrroloquinoline-quinone synthase PqqC [Oecophyllibacter saccharovorans]|uniref:pyrroloquinoline-quinone synthase PqqC n=1 Tax=Oecophyllibacter saccharovorans TaxID=2558360 RepID=UPI0011677369|nr:pyrroloquinoline-quinone synthase PqqC [Oecophyllibacter saccharovorans]TPW35288.1 pyrroloquinoline-quinone synthase PqqC [Oecophyllibacter saccharovorans]